jgi:hypothetical protein
MADRVTLDEALACYAISRDVALAPLVRFSALQTSFRHLQALCARAPLHLRHATLARVARACQY